MEHDDSRSYRQHDRSRLPKFAITFVIFMAFYPLSMGPMVYLEARHDPLLSLFPQSSSPYQFWYQTVYGPLVPWWNQACSSANDPQWLPSWYVSESLHPPGGAWYRQYLSWFSELGRRHHEPHGKP